MPPFTLATLLAVLVLTTPVVAGDIEPVDRSLPLILPDTVEAFYASREGKSAWTPATLEQLRIAIRKSESHGLTPADYHAERLLDPEIRREPGLLDVFATDAFLSLARDILQGRVDPRSLEPTWNRSPRERDLVTELSAAIDAGEVAARLDEMQPDAPAYQVLRDALALYRSARAEGSWPAVESGEALKRGMTSPRVASLRARLRATGLLVDEGDAGENEFDAAVEEAVAAFQRRVGIEADGVAGAMTVAELNKTADDRIDQIRANLERWRWLAEELPDRHIRVNIADYRLEARNQGRIERVHDVIVGKRFRKTPVFQETMRYIVFNPWWETPPSLARLDKLPSFQKDPGLPVRLGFEVIDRDGTKLDPATVNWSAYTSRSFPLRLRQRPGPQNALGQVKMMFPNPHNVYLHDTPTRELFTKTERAFSSGCIRVRDPLGLAEWALSRTPDWERARIDQVVAGGKETRANLADGVPVMILYFTAVAEPDGTLRLIHDVYDRDKPLLAALDGPEVP